MTDSVHLRAHAALMECEPEAKAAAAAALHADWTAGALAAGEAPPPERVAVPGRPPRPSLVPPRRLPSRGLGTQEGRRALVHAIAHIEFNAINLALDAVYRFRGMPPAFYRDWLQVAVEEARHFALLRGRLRELGRDYGDYPAHDGLWQAALETDGDVLLRMALVPRVLEARGLDVTPEMMRRLQAAGDTATVAVLEVILREEIGHVAIGSRWYHHECERRGLDPVPTFVALLRRHMKGRIKGPFHRHARLQAGFSEQELAALAALDAPARS